MQIEHKKNSAYYLSFPMVDSSTPASFKSSVSPVDTAYYKDGAGAWTSLAITDTASEIGSTGVYEIDLTAAEMNHDQVMIKFSVAGAADSAFLLDMRTKLVDDLQDVSAADVNSQCDTAISDAALATAANLATVDTVVDGIQTDLSNGTDGLGALKTLIDTVDTNVDAILVDTATTIPGQITALNDIDAATVNAQCDTAITDAALATAAALATVDSNVDAILLDTAEIGAAGAGLTAIPWNASWDAEVQSEVTDGLNAYDPPTKAEMDALLTTALSESYAADGSAPTVAQALLMIMSFLQERSVAGTTLTCKQLDGSTTAMTFTLDDASAPTSITRAT